MTEPPDDKAETSDATRSGQRPRRTHPLRADTGTTPARALYCMHCGFSLPSQAKFCSACGATSSLADSAESRNEFRSDLGKTSSPQPNPERGDSASVAAPPVTPPQRGWWKQNAIDKHSALAKIHPILALGLFAVASGVGIAQTINGALPIGGWIAAGYLVAWVVARKGYANTSWWGIYGAVLFPVAIIHALLKPATPEVRFESATSKWAIDEGVLCGYRDAYAPEPCVKQKGHHRLGLRKSPHDYREEARGRL